MSRSNKKWIADLGQRSSKQELALADLRVELLRRLRWGLDSYTRADDAFLEDAVQDSLLQILSRLEQFEGRSKFLTWATTIAIRTAISELRKRKWKDVSLDQILETTSPKSESTEIESSDPASPNDGRAVLDKMHELIANRLTERQRKALMAELRGMPQDEIARHLGSNRNAVYKLTHDARKKLRKGLEEAGFWGHEVLNTTSH